MYLLKQWREGRVVVLLAALGLGWEVAVVICRILRFRHGQQTGWDISGDLELYFSVEGMLIGLWAWISGGIGMGRNIGENSGSFLLTRPRPRAWFVWNDWLVAMTRTFTVSVAANFILWPLFEETMMRDGLQPERAVLAHMGVISLGDLLCLQTLVAFAFAGLLYSLAYTATLFLKRQSGIVLSGSLLVFYMLARSILHRMHGVELPSLMQPLLAESAAMMVVPGITASLSVRLLIILLLPFAAQHVLDRADI